MHDSCWMIMDDAIDEPVELSKIKTDTNDLIVFHDKSGGTIWMGVLIGVVFAVIMVKATLSTSDFVQRLVYILIMFFLVLWTIAWMWTGYLVVTTVSIDKKSQSIVMQKSSPIKRFESVIEIPFSALKEIKITSDTDSEGDRFWDVNLIQKYENKPAFIYGTFLESKAQEVAEKIHKITGKEVLSCITINKALV